MGEKQPGQHQRPRLTEPSTHPAVPGPDLLELCVSERCCCQWLSLCNLLMVEKWRYCPKDDLIGNYIRYPAMNGSEDDGKEHDKG